VANVLPSCLVADIRGKVGDQVFSRNRGGLYVKSVPDWEQPFSWPWQIAKDTLTLCSKSWSDDIGPDWRALWDDYAARYPIRGRFQGSNANKGRGWFIRTNFYYAYINTSIIYGLPPSDDPKPSINLTFTANVAANNLLADMSSMTYGQTWPGLVCMAFIGLPTSTARNHYTLSWTYLAMQRRIDLDWEFPIWELFTPNPVAANRRYWLRLVFQEEADGALARPSVNFADSA